MNRPESSKFVPGLPADDDIDTPTNAPVDDSIKIYDGVAECTMNDADTLKSVKSRAKDLAIQKVQQKIADYVYGFWKDRYLTLPDDEVLSIANEICTITDVKYNVFDSDDNTLVRATVLAQVDDNDVMNYIIQFFKERNELKIQNESLRKENESLKHENEDLRRQIDELKSSQTNYQQNNPQVISQVIDEDKIALSNKKLSEAIELHSNRDDKGAIKLYDEAIELNPKNAKAYFYRGWLYYRSLGQKERAIQDYSKAIELNPKNAEAYDERASVYYNLRQYERAIQDYNKAIELNPNDANLYNSRSWAYIFLNQNEQAIQDCNKAIQLNPNDASAYNSRSLCYRHLGETAKAQADFAKAKELGW